MRFVPLSWSCRNLHSSLGSYGWSICAAPLLLCTVGPGPWLSCWHRICGSRVFRSGHPPIEVFFCRGAEMYRARTATRAWDKATRRNAVNRGLHFRRLVWSCPRVPDFVLLLPFVVLFWPACEWGGPSGAVCRPMGRSWGSRYTFGWLRVKIFREFVQTTAVRAVKQPFSPRCKT